jgi:LysM repeat protein
LKQKLSFIEILKMGNQDSKGEVRDPNGETTDIHIEGIKNEQTIKSNDDGIAVSPYDTVRFAYETYEKAENANRKRELEEATIQVQKIVEKSSIYQTNPTKQETLLSELNAVNIQIEEIQSVSKSSEILDINNLNDMDNFYFHKVEKSDTLEGIALRYKTTVSEIKRLNKLYTKFDIFGKSLLIIPKCKEEQKLTEEEQYMRQYAIQLFQNEMDCADEQLCLSYLEKAKFNLREAIKKYRFDLVKNNIISPQPPSPSPSPSPLPQDDLIYIDDLPTINDILINSPFGGVDQ